MRQLITAVIAGMLVAAAVATPTAAQFRYNNDGFAFLTALKSGDNAKAIELVEAKGSTVVNFRGDDGDAALHIATRNRSEKWIAYLLQRGADPNLGGRDGDTPLIIAARTGFIPAVDLLLRRGAELDLVNKRGETPLIVAVQGRHPDFVRLLLRRGADPDKNDFVAGYSARDYAKRDRRIPQMAQMMEEIPAGGSKAD